MRCDRRGLACAMVACAVACSRERPADAPMDVALVIPAATDAGPAIRAPEQSDYLSVPKAAPATSSATPIDDDGVDIDECREVVAWMRRCVGESAAKDVARNLKQASQSSDPSVRQAIAEACRRMADAYAQSGGCMP